MFVGVIVLLYIVYGITISFTSDLMFCRKALKVKSYVVFS